VPKLKTTRYERNLDIADSLALIRMSDHDRALARTYMDEGTRIADAMLHALRGIRTMIADTGKLLSGHRLRLRA